MWEVVDKSSSIRETLTERLKVHAGWLVRTFYRHSYGGTCAMTFVPDPNHKWKLKN